MPDFDTIRSPQPTRVTAQTDAGPVLLHYDRNAVIGAVQSAIYTMPIRDRLARLLLDWDVTMHGEPWHPEALEDVTHWQGVIREEREQAHAAWTALKARHDALTPEAVASAIAAKTLRPLGAEPVAIDAPITTQDRRTAYSAAWRAFLDELPNDFVQALDDEVLDDFLGGRWRMKDMATGSPPKAATVSVPGSFHTPIAS